MPTLVQELTQPQLEWLYKYQCLLDTTDPQECDYETMVESTLTGRQSGDHSGDESPLRRKRARMHQECTLCKSVPFPYSGDNLSWDQQFKNLLTFKSVHGVSLFGPTAKECNIEHSPSYSFSFAPQHCKVPPCSDVCCPELSNWIGLQRLKYKCPSKYGGLSNTRTKMIEKALFEISSNCLAETISFA
jgi:hypothetical protein